jgi:hypothetical protein
LSVATKRWNRGMGENLKVVMVDHDTVGNLAKNGRFWKVLR